MPFGGRKSKLGQVALLTFMHVFTHKKWPTTAIKSFKYAIKHIFFMYCFLLFIPHSFFLICNCFGYLYEKCISLKSSNSNFQPVCQVEVMYL